jgi:hypothetical protein
VKQSASQLLNFAILSFYSGACTSCVQAIICFDLKREPNAATRTGIVHATGMPPSPFETIESAEEFMNLLHGEIEKAQAEIEMLLASDETTYSRQEEALRLVVHKLVKLKSHSDASQRLLRDLRTLRNLLLR